MVFLCLYWGLVVYCFFLLTFVIISFYCFISMEYSSFCIPHFCFLFLFVYVEILCRIIENNWTCFKIETNWTSTHKLSVTSPSTFLND